MYLYVTIQSLEDYYKNPKVRTKLTIEQVIQEPTLILPYEKLNEQLVKEINPRAIIFSGFSNSFETFEAKQFIKMYEVINNMDIPMLCICGSHQLLGKFYNENVYETERFYDEPIRELEKQDK